MNFSTALLCFSLVFNSSVYAVELEFLSKEELSAVKKMDISESDLKSLDWKGVKSLLKDKYAQVKDDLQEAAKEKMEEVAKEALEKEKADLKREAIKIGAGYTFSTLSLFAATLIAPQALMVCKTKPSAVIYAGSAAVYIFQEMRNVKTLKAEQLAELEVVTGLNVDKTKSAKENSEILKAKVDLQVGYLLAYKRSIEYTVKALKKKAKNAKMVSIGFLAASAAAAAEQLNWLSGGGACVASNASSAGDLNYSAELDQKYERLIEEATSAQDKWALYYEWESFKFGRGQSPSLKEYDDFKNIYADNTLFKNVMQIVSSTLVANVWAQESKKVLLIPQFKDNKMANWLGDLDKLGIVGGVATNLVAYMAGWQMSFLKSVMASGTSRAVTFGAQGALAFTAGTLFGSAAENLEEKLNMVERLILKIQKLTKKGLTYIIPADDDARRFQELMNKLGVVSHQLITEMSLKDAYDYLKKVKEKAKNLSPEDQALVKKYEDDLKEKLGADKIKDEVDNLKDKGQDKVEEIKEIKEDLKNDPEKKLPVPEEAQGLLLDQQTSHVPWRPLKIVAGVLDFLSPPFVQAEAVPSIEVLTQIKDLECSEKRSCPDLTFPKGTNPNLKILSQYLGWYEKYYQSTAIKNEKAEIAYSDALEKNKDQVQNYRNYIFQKIPVVNGASNRGYGIYETQKIKNEEAQFAKFYRSLSAKDQAELDGSMRPERMGSSGAKVSPQSAKMSLVEMMTVKKLLDRLEASEVKDEARPDMSFVEREKAESAALDFGNTSIHPKEADIFEIIHVRYLKFLKKNFP